VKGKSVVTGVCLILMSAVLFYLVAQSSPSFGSIHNLPLKVYLPDTLAVTGALNVVASLVWDWRGYDTLGETTVFFAAAMGAVLLFRLRGDSR
jgi:multisubunit Na+/H+ antiporter MnhB subunit